MKQYKGNGNGKDMEMENEPAEPVRVQTPTDATKGTCGHDKMPNNYRSTFYYGNGKKTGTSGGGSKVY